MNRSQAFLMGMLLFIIGTAIGSFVASATWIFWLGVVCVGGLLVIWRGVGNTVQIAFFICVFLLGMWRVANVRDSFLQLTPQKEFKGPGVITAVHPKGDYVQLIIALNEEDKKVLMNSSLKNDAIRTGNKVTLSCLLTLPKSIEDFDYRMHLAKEGVGWICKRGVIEKRKNTRSALGILNDVRLRGEEIIGRLMPEPEAGLAKGIIFGGNNLLAEQTANAFSMVGLTHVVAVSGFNVTIIAEYLILFGIAIGLWRRQAIVFAIVGITLFVAMVGFSASALRAGCMASILLWAMRYGRLSASLSAIVFSATMMLAINPLLLRWDVGFQLSFLATIGIIYLAPLYEHEWVKQHSFFGMTEAALLTISAQIFVLPVLLYNFKSLSLISVFANMIVLPMIPLAMLLVFLVIVCGSFSLWAGLPFAWLAYLVLHGIITIVHYFAQVPWASVEFSINMPIIVLWYLFLFVIIVRLKRNT